MRTGYLLSTGMTLGRVKIAHSRESYIVIIVTLRIKLKIVKYHLKTTELYFHPAEKLRTYWRLFVSNAFSTFSAGQKIISGVYRCTTELYIFN